MFGKQEIIKLLLVNGADPKLKNIDGETSYDFAESHDYKGIEEIRELLKQTNKKSQN